METSGVSLSGRLVQHGIHNRRQASQGESPLEIKIARHSDELMVDHFYLFCMW